jgi:general secretion pathway protein G
MMELLVAITLMAIISAAVVAKIGPSSRQYARDTQRRADINAIASALEMYRNDNHPGYPLAADYPGALTAGGYMTTVPKDPSTAADYTYTPGTCATLCRTFSLCATGEKSAIPCVTNP